MNKKRRFKAKRKRKLRKANKDWINACNSGTFSFVIDGILFRP